MSISVSEAKWYRELTPYQWRVLVCACLGWAFGGLIFGPIADRYGRAKTMAITILIYASFTGLCSIARTY